MEKVELPGHMSLNERDLLTVEPPSHDLDGVAIVAATVAERPCAMVADFILAAEERPGMVFVFLDPAAPTHGRISRASLIGITLISLRSLISFATTDQQYSALDDVAWRRGPHGGPLLRGGHCVMELSVGKRLTASTRTVLVGSVLEPLRTVESYGRTFGPPSAR